MDDVLLTYYEQELTYIRELGSEFAKKYPKIAGRLLLEPEKSEDPHVERIIEAFSFISGRILKKIDDDFPEITQSLLNIIYPHYVAPIPSMTVVQVEPIRQNISEAGFKLDRDTALFSQPVAGTPCAFKTCMPLKIWPVGVVNARFVDPDFVRDDGALLAIAIELKTFNNLSFGAINWDTLRFFLNGQSHHVYQLYELLLNNITAIELSAIDSRGRQNVLTLPPESFRPVGFEEEETLLPFTTRSFPGYRLLLEYFCFPEKFLFLDLHGLEILHQAKLGDAITLSIYLNKVPKKKIVIDKDTFTLNAATAINLFKRIAEPIRVEHQKPEYLVIPDIRRQQGTEIFSMDKVVSTNVTGTEEGAEFKPFYSIRHHLGEGEDFKRRAFWHGMRRPSGKKDDSGTDVYLSFVDLDFKATDPGVEILTAHVTCTNRDLPARLPFGNPAGDFSLEVAAPVSAIRCLMKPTPTRRPTLGGALQWRLISHLSLNYMSIAQKGEDALREILKLYDFENSPSTRQQISGIVSIQAKHVTRRINMSMSRGVQVTLELDEEKFVGAGLFLFASILECFLGQYVSVNSFSQLVLKTTQNKEILKQWQPRSGERVLL